MYIVHIASEMAPLAKVGGLGDVVYGLSRASQKLGHKVEVFLPKYDFLKNDNQAHLVELPGNWSKIYGFENDPLRFLSFVKAVLPQVVKMQPDVIHLHDWPTAFFAPLYRAAGGKARIILTIHNAEYMGRWNMKEIGVEVPKEYLSQIADPVLPDTANFLKAGIVFADQVVAVSTTYKHEILESGLILQDVLRQNRAKLSGILNGIDYDYWNPAADSHLFETYTNLLGKQENKRLLREKFKMPQENRPILAVITRLVPQKGPDLIAYGLRYWISLGGQCILLGSSPLPKIQHHFEELKKEWEDEKNAVISLEYNEPLSHQVYAAADFFFVPSIVEPCGLTQLIALRYGTIPIVRSTGGLKDTVFDLETSAAPEERRNGFTFDIPDPRGVEWGLSRAYKTWTEKPEEWKKLVVHAMKMDFSWDVSAKEYLKIYTIPKK